MANEKPKIDLDALAKHFEKRNESTKAYVEKELAKQKPKETRGPYGKPEKDVEKECLIWMRSKGWSVNIFEAKATWSPSAGRWLQQSMKAGTADCMGNTQDGIGVTIEFKAPGRSSTLRDKQRDFLVSKINTNTFACVVDSCDRLKKIYEDWVEMRKDNLQLAQEYLISMLPKQKTRLNDEPLFDE